MSDFMQRKTRITIKLFNYVVHVVLSSDPNTARAKTRVLGDWEQDDNLAALHCGTTDPVSYVFLPFQADIGLVVHESSHCFWRIMEFIGAKHEDEVMAYTIAHITRETCKFIAKTGDPTKITTDNPDSASDISCHSKDISRQTSNSLTLGQTIHTLNKPTIQKTTKVWEILKPLYDQMYENNSVIRHARAA